MMMVELKRRLTNALRQDDAMQKRRLERWLLRNGYSRSQAKARVASGRRGGTL
jgi:hypothetical protein